MEKQILTPSEYCFEKGSELQNGRITFSKAQKKYFCNTYTYHDFNNLSKLSVELLTGRMINFYTGYKSYIKSEGWDGIKLEMDL